jgi:hypothetical protein
MKYAVPAILVLAVTTMAFAIETVPAASAAPAPAAEKRACFQANDVTNWKEGEKHAFNIRTSRGDVYTSRLIGVCPEIDWTQSIAIKTRTSSFICEGDDAEVIVTHSNMGHQSCLIDKITKLSKEDADKLDKKYKP